MPAGRPVKPIDQDQLLRLAETFATMEEIAYVLDVSVDTLRNYSEIIKQGQAKTRIALRRKQLDKAMNEGSERMLIWLGKQILNQHDKIQHTTQNPLETTSDTELERIILEASEQIKNGTRLIPSGKE